MKILGIDLGRSRTGLAIANDEINFAFPLKTINEQNEKILLLEILKIVSKNNIKKVVIGLPKHSNNEEGDGANITKKFACFIKEKLKNVEIIMQNEWGTTITAHNYLNEIGYKKNRKKIIDSVSATIILQNFLDSKKFFN
ncbi:MAG: Holliday junction resolvase RuvX [Oscillospiraceae bacterium]|nr:Holliday junction resolvase RuvX [Oscillospiraceae bacterium]